MFSVIFVYFLFQPLGCNIINKSCVAMKTNCVAIASLFIIWRSIIMSKCHECSKITTQKASGYVLPSVPRVTEISHLSIPPYFRPRSSCPTMFFELSK